MIETPRLIIRYLTIDDTQKIYKMSLEKGMKEFIPDQVYESKEQAKQVVEYLIAQYSEIPKPDEKPFVLGIVLKETGELIGHVGLSPYDGIVEIGYAVEDKQQGKGLATEAVKATSEWALKELRLISVWGIVDKSNRGSIKVLERSGYVFIKEVKDKLRYEYKLRR